MRDKHLGVSIIGERLSEAMKAKGVDQETVARAVGCTQSAISLILSGKTHRSRLLPDIAQFLGVSLRWLKGQDVSPDEVEDESGAHAAEASKLRVLMVPMVLPSEDALTQMFSALLALERPEDTRDERARFLAQLLPAALAQLQAQIPVEDVVANLARATKSLSAPKVRRARQ